MARKPPSQLDEDAWLEVIVKMDEVYSQLVQDEIELEQKNAELEQSQQFIASMLASMSDILLACDPQGLIEESNQSLRNLVSSDEAGLLGLSVYSLLGDDASIQRLRSLLGGLRRDNDSASLEVNFRGNAGELLPVDLSCTVRSGLHGRCLGHVLVGRPLGELQHAYRQLHEAHEALKRTQQQLLHAEKMASLGRLVAGVAHELNNPISFVLANAHVLGGYGKRLQDYLQAVHDEQPIDQREVLRRQLRIDPLLADLPLLIEGTLEGAQRTADIVSALKRFSAMDRGHPGEASLNDVIERAIHWITRGTAPDLIVHWQPADDVQVQGNAGQLLQVLMNLTQNAYDAARHATAEPPQLWIELTREPGWANLSLRDNGAGIAEHHLSQVFEPFFTTKPAGQGTGLGLAISYGIVERCGGTLTAGNHHSGGAEFHLRLPSLD
ncbi:MULTISPECIES: sensor histidine kinase [Pseudomonas]|uniref:histidine kinase n=1 Tax=Pseudomonas nitroreducens TaxID=46680 RepID=A0ABS0KKY9_PSENT|nr:MULTISPECIES: ATP-binding protein [Pseudomonas]MBG6288733.1 PAS domain-containing sensor histidine kinase [Pseudomonas nitroreducens]NMZ58750.1 PAS domain-containing sensor histidine kinase [Pseudomonas nitroreducens]OBY49201.1 PAS domain-containing sensor histidine kinase [Pseudomonas sp. AU12215]UCL89588.1 PAS domain-containing sensor histidine kinase [Pseudomonas sp. HS-18]SNS64597.1 PAS/PAC sensor signal transduction histidine kinase [Pseudomonas nitroreducens]